VGVGGERAEGEREEKRSEKGAREICQGRFP
jgi:hypothetical protein